MVDNGQTIILGGLMRSKLDSSGSGIPYLRRIPLLGYLFGGTRKKIDKTELIFLITPQVIYTQGGGRRHYQRIFPTSGKHEKTDRGERVLGITQLQYYSNRSPMCATFKPLLIPRSEGPSA